MRVDRRELEKHMSPELAGKILVKAFRYGITTQSNRKIKNKTAALVNSFLLSEMIEKMEDHIKTMRADAIAGNKVIVRKLKRIEKKLKKESHENTNKCSCI